MRVISQDTTTYRGGERRTRHSEPAAALTPTELFTQAALVPLAAVIPLAVVFTRGVTAAGVANALQVLAALTAVAAGVALLVCWRMAGRAMTGWLGVALVDLGLLSVAYHSLSTLAFGDRGAIEPFGRVVVCIAVVAAVFAALRSPAVDAGFHPVRALAAMAVASLGVLVVLDRWSSLSAPVLASATAGFCAALWLGLAGYAFSRLRRGGHSDSLWVGAFAAGRGIAAVVSAAFPVSGGAEVAAEMVMLLAAGVALVAGASTLRGRVQGQDRYAFHLQTGLEELRRDMEAERAELDERLHDLRNAVAAMRTADSTLRRFGGRLDEATRVSLADALTSELSRLQSLIEPGRRVRMQDFCLAAALAPVLATERTRGATIEAGGETLVPGDPDGAAQVVQNLLANARLYAPGTPVRVVSERIADRVILSVRDEGPGVPDSERGAIFARGARGTTSRGTGGSGLGLYVAARLMAEMGGSLHLAQGTGGARFVMEMQAAPVGAEETGRAAMPQPASNV